MKNIKSLIILAFLGSMTFFLSCKKSYECHCEGPNGAHEHFDIKAKNKSAADSECDKKEGGTFSSCDIE